MTEDKGYITLKDIITSFRPILIVLAIIAISTFIRANGGT